MSSKSPILPSSSFQPEADVKSLPDVSTEIAPSQSQSISSSTTTGDYSIPGTVIQPGISTVSGQNSITGSIQSSATTPEVYSTPSVVVTGTLIFFHIYVNKCTFYKLSNFEISFSQLTILTLLL